MALIGIAVAVGGATLFLLDLLGIVEVGTETAQLVGKVSERLIGDEDRRTRLLQPPDCRSTGNGGTAR